MGQAEPSSGSCLGILGRLLVCPVWGCNLAGLMGQLEAQQMELHLWCST